MGFQILICLAGLIAGILFALGIPDGHLFKYLIPMIMALLATRFWNPGWYRMSRYQVVSFMAGLLCFFLVGWVLIAVNRFVPDEYQQGKSTIAGEIVSYREVTEKLAQIEVSVKQEKVASGWVRRTGKMVLLAKPDTSVSYHRGDFWFFGPIKITPVSAKPTPNGFVPKRYWLSRGVRYEARLTPGNGYLLKERRLPSILDFFQRWQQTLSDRIDQIPLSEPARSLIKALIYGDTSDVEKSTMTDFSRAGIIHVLSVSGLHIGIIYFIIAWMLKKVRIISVKWRSLISLVVVWLYTGVSGLSPSAMRAAAMISLFEFARLGRRGTPGIEVLASTALLHCLINPYTIFSAGAQLSYLAVAGIMIWNPIFNPILLKMNKVVRYFVSSITISIAAQSLITPVLLFWFGWFPLYFLIGNLILLPLMVFAFYFGLAICGLDFAGLSVPFFCKIMDTLIAFVMKGAGWLGNLPGNLFKPEGLVWPDLILYYLILLSVKSYCDSPDPRKVQRMLAGTALIMAFRYFLM